jgi:hypothetical protein
LLATRPNREIVWIRKRGEDHEAVAMDYVPANVLEPD